MRGVKCSHYIMCFVIKFRHHYSATLDPGCFVKFQKDGRFRIPVQLDENRKKIEVSVKVML